MMSATVRSALGGEVILAKAGVPEGKHHDSQDQHGQPPEIALQDVQQHRTAPDHTSCITDEARSGFWPEILGSRAPKLVRGQDAPVPSARSR